jgi:hypothetical protein
MPRTLRSEYPGAIYLLRFEISKVKSGNREAT